VPSNPVRVRPGRAVAWPSPLIIKWLRDQIAAAGADPAMVPDEPFRFRRLPEVEDITGLSKSSIYRKVDEGTFPAPVTLGGSAINTANAA